MHRSSQAGRREFIAMMAIIMSCVALSVDAILPVFSDMRGDIAFSDPDDVQYTIGVLFFGLATGQLIFGPLSDAYGRRISLFIGTALFILGSLLVFLAKEPGLLFLGRFIQGLGAAGPRVLSTAMVRDRFVGREMASVQSLILAIFIFVPMLAPAIGEAISSLLGWRYIFAFLIFYSFSAAIWLYLRQEETLLIEKRRALSLTLLLQACKEVLTHRACMLFTLAAATVFSILISYLQAAEDLYIGIYHQADLFVFWFALVAAAVALSSWLNGRWVRRFGMRHLSLIAAACLIIISLLYGLFIILTGQDHFVLTLLWLMGCFFCMGFLFGNLNALALEPMGHIAGLASSLIATISTLIAVPLGSIISRNVDGQISHLVIGFAICGLCTLLLIKGGGKRTLDK